mmetsp:Transcript_32498/g.56195  ORF Transcript_32498/g.56195 Transcript_32498/m.56195 type:complete len:933 (-) Transcript_32498:3242-6040(-)
MELQISEAFLTVLSIDNAAREQAEAYLKGISKSPGFLKALTVLASSASIADVKLASAVHLKNSLINWECFDEAERDFVKAAVLPNLRLSTPEKVRAQFAQIVKKLWELERPWPSVLEGLTQALTSEDPDMLYGGLYMLLQIVSVYEFTSKPAVRAELYQITKSFFPCLLYLLNKLLGNLTEASFQYISLILNAIWCTIYIELNPEILIPEVYHSVCLSLASVLSINLGLLEDMPTNEAETFRLDIHPAWQCKRWSIQLLHRFFLRYDNTTHPKYGQIATVFYENIAPQTLAIVFSEIFKFGSKHLPSLYTSYLLKFLTQALNYGPTLEQVKPKVADLMSLVVLPLLSRVPQDEELWNNDQIEFIRKENELMRSYFSPKCSALDFLMKLCEKGYLDAILYHLSVSLQGATDLVKKEALLLAIGSLELCIAKRPSAIQIIEPLFINYVNADLTSPIGFSRMRAVWMYSQFAKFPFKNEETNMYVCTTICKLLMDEALAVQIESAIAIPRLVDWPAMKKIIVPELEGLIRAYLKLMDLIDSEDLVESLEEIVGTFNVEIAPFAVDLTKSLTEHFSRMAFETTKNGGESGMAAASALSTVGKIIDAFETNTAQLKEIATIVYPVLEYCLDVMGCEFYEEAIHILTYLLYYSEAGSIPGLVNVYPLLLKSVMGDFDVEPYAHDQMETFFAPLSNLISKYPAEIAQYIPGTIALSTYLLNHSFPELACKIWMCLLENMKEPIHQYIPNLLTTAMAFHESSDPEGAIMIFVVCEALWFFPSIATEVLRLVLPSFTEKLVRLNVSGFQDFYLLKVLAIGLVSLMQNPILGDAFVDRILQQLTKIVLKLDDLKEDGLPSKSTPFAAAEEYEHLIDGDPQGDDESYLAELNLEEDLYDSPIELLNEVSLMKRLLALQPSLSTRMNAVVPADELRSLDRLLSS